MVLCPIPRLVFRPDTGTNHGTPWEYDRRVPLAFHGPGIPAQVRQGRSPWNRKPTHARAPKVAKDERVRNNFV